MYRLLIALVFVCAGALGAGDTHDAHAPALGHEAGGHPDTAAHAAAMDALEGDHAAAAHDGEHHAAEHEGGHGHPELPNAIHLITHLSHMDTDTAGSVGWFLATFTPNIFSLIIAALVCVLFVGGASKLREQPGPWQNVVEMVLEGFSNFICSILGEKYGPRFVPFLGSLFLFIWFHNMAGLVPFFMAPTSKITTTAGLAIVVFLYVQYIAMTELGPKKYGLHLMGDPDNAIMWCMAPLFLVLHLIGELAKPLSLALRLFGNILGEDILLGSFMLMGVALMGLVGVGAYIGLPLHLPFFFLSLLLGTIQALVFMLLSTIYILMVLPHEEHGEEAHS